MANTAAPKIPLHPTTKHNTTAIDGGGTKTTNKTIEETYQKKSQLEHILLRPDTYVGSIEKHTQTLWIYENGEMVHRPITFVPGLYKIFDEILVNAADNKQRDPTMDSVKVVIDPEKNLISVFNNGDGVPVEVHKEEGIYVPELIFGHLLTSSNYDDNVKKTTGGRNGYGAKLTNIFSTEFVIETADGKRLKKYKQVFSNNMGNKTEPSISSCKAGENWTKVTFMPDLAKFNMTHLEDDVVSLMKKRVVDLAGTLGKTVKVHLNGQQVPVKSFVDYVNLYLLSASKSKPEPHPRIVEKVNDRWEVCVSLSDGQFQQVSFVNGIATIKGGSHVEYVTNQITSYVMTIVNKKNKNANVKAHAVKNHLWMFVNAKIDNPAFDSQTKETLTTRQGSFGSKCELSPDFLKKVAKSGIVDSLLTWADFKLNKDLKKTDGAKRQRLTGITKLEDANDAGGRNSDKCTLILTEGDSAKALAMAGISVVGRNYYGVFPLRGKLLNVREATHKQMMDNAEIQSIKQILGLQHGKEYDSVKSLRYGHLMIMTDQDHDGSHIKGLLINFIHNFWPSLLKIPSFMIEFITPIVKATHKKNGKVLSFYTMPEYENWKESLGGNAIDWSIKYYKGLGTSTSKEGKEYFRDLDKHRKDFVWVDEKDGDAIEMAFSKKKIDARKTWLRQFEPGTYLDQTEKLIKYSDFVNKELILFSLADLQRSIPSMVDGLKPGQRKILFCSFKRNFTKEAKVAQFSGYVSEHSAYHHGEQSLASTIIGLAQNFVGSNNINLLQPNGQFGTRNQGGKDHASARYIFTKLSPLTRFLFPKDDDILLDYLNEDGQSIEPTWYMPILPFVLVNGSEGIGTGWSSYIPNYNPRDIVANIRRLLNDEQMEPIDPWYKGFKGLIEKSATKETGVTYTLSGTVEEVDSTMIRITELPVRRWTQDYKEFLEGLMTGNDKIKEPFIRDYREHNDDTSVHFEVYLSEENLSIAKQEGILKKFKLTTTISTSNMHLFDAKGVIKKYDTPEEILEEFFHMRLEFYEKRKKVLLNNLEMDLLKLDNKVRFILGVVEGKIVVSNRKRAELFLELHQKGFTPFPKKSKGVEVAIAGSTEGDDNEESAEVVDKAGVKASDYEYLLSMSIGTLTREKVEELCNEKKYLENQVEELRGSTARSLWMKDLDAFEEEYTKIEKEEAEEEVMKGVGTKKNVITKGVSRPVPRNTTKKTAIASKTFDSDDQDYLSAVAKPNARGRTKKAPVTVQLQPTSVESDDEDNEILELKDRLAKYNLNSSPDQTGLEVDDAKEQPKKKASSKRTAAAKKTSIVTEISDDEDVGDFMPTIFEDEDDDKDFAAPKGKKGGGGRKITAKAKSAITTAKKRGGVQKLITDVLKPAETTADSPEKKVRRMRASPFNKKSGSVIGRLGKNSPSSSEEASYDITEDAVATTRRAMPQRANRGRKASYVLSESDSEGKVEMTDDSDFEGKVEMTDDSDFDEEH